MKLLFISLALLLSTTVFAKSWSLQESSAFDKVLHLFICSEEAPILCKHFNLSSRDTAAVQIGQLCGYDGAVLRATWQNERIVDITCSSRLTNSECMSMGFDCLLNGQCVKDLSLKPGVDKNSKDYIQALEDILNNPNHIYRYTQYYYICPLSKL